MPSIWRSLLTWLLVLAMPVQALAAVGMQHCAPMHERMQAGVMLASTPHEHGNEAAPIDAAPAAAAVTAVDALDQFGAPVFAVPTGDAKCSACAACGLALGLAAAGPVSAAVPGGPGLAQLAPPVLPLFVPGGLERPPRSLRA